MRGKKWLLLLLVILAAGSISWAQEDSTHSHSFGDIALMAIATSNDQVPFWMRSNKFGAIPEKGASAAMELRYTRLLNSERLLDWEGGIDTRFNVGKTSSMQLIEGYLGVKFSIFRIRAGRSKGFTGLVDSSLSSGAFSISGNAPGIPKVEAGIPEYWSLPLTAGVFSVKGNVALGFIGKIPSVKAGALTGKDAVTYYHEKSFYARLGKERWPVRLYAGFNHQVFWGDEKEYYYVWNLPPWQTAVKAITGQVYRGSKIGNHLGSIDQGIEVNYKKKVLITGYHQFFYDVGGLYHLNNIKDGLWGLSLKNSRYSGQGWRKILVEILFSKSQGGEPDAKITPSGDEDYYNGMYLEGWSYQKENLGNPLFASRRYARTDLPNNPAQYFISNRLVAAHLGADFSWKSYSFLVFTTLSAHYGTWKTSEYGSSRGSIRYIAPPPYFERALQFSGYIEASRPIGNHFNLGFALAIDQGKVLYNSFGGQIRLSRSF